MFSLIASLSFEEEFYFAFLVNYSREYYNQDQCEHMQGKKLLARR